MKVYLVESGEYSDRQIDGVFSTYEKAEKYIAHCKHHDTWETTYCIMEYDIDDNFIDNDVEIWYKYEVNMTKGRNHCIDDIIPVYKSDVEKDKINKYNSYGTSKYIEFITYHKDKDLSMKSIEDRYMKAKAEEMLL